MLHPQQFHNDFTKNPIWYVVINSNLRQILKSLVYSPITVYRMKVLLGKYYGCNIIPKIILTPQI